MWCFAKDTTHNNRFLWLADWLAAAYFRAQIKQPKHTDFIVWLLSHLPNKTKRDLRCKIAPSISGTDNSHSICSSLLML